MKKREKSLGTQVDKMNVDASLDVLIERNKEACELFLSQLSVVEELDNEVAKIDTTRTPAYHELGRQAVALKKNLGHGGWGPYLKRINRSQRTINRAMTIFIAFPDKSKSAKWIALSLIDAEEAARQVIEKTKGKARASRKSKTPKGQIVANEPAPAPSDQQSVTDTGVVRAKHQELPAVVSNDEKDAVAEGGIVAVQDRFDEELTRSLMSDDPTDEEKEAFCTYSDCIGNVDRAFQVAVKIFWHFAEGTIHISGSSVAELRNSNDMRAVLQNLETTVQATHATVASGLTNTSVQAPEVSEPPNMESDLPHKPR